MKDTQILLYSDHLGSSSYLIDADGKSYQFLLYLPWGETLVEQKVADFSTPYQFNGKELDKVTGLYNYGARYYDPSLSIWMSVDPLADAPLNVGTSPYTYVWNNPLKFIDPDGRHGTSHHIDSDGNYIGEVKDGDESVYMHENGTSLTDISGRIYQSPAPQGQFGDTSGGGVHVGGIGAEVSAPRRIDQAIQIGFTGTAIVGLGITGSFGFAFDDYDGIGFYGEIGVGWGFDISGGGEIVTHRSTASDGKLYLRDLQGLGAMKNYGGAQWDISTGGNDDSTMNLISSRGSKYSSSGLGVSLSVSPVSYTETSSATGVATLKRPTKTRKPKKIIFP